MSYYAGQCQHCGDAMYGWRRTKTFCDTKCRVAAFRARNANARSSATAPERPVAARWALPRRMTAQDALRILGLAFWPSPRALTRVWRELVREHHPDVGGDVRVCAAINRAYDYLKH